MQSSFPVIFGSFLKSAPGNVCYLHRLRRSHKTDSMSGVETSVLRTSLQYAQLAEQRTYHTVAGQTESSVRGRCLTKGQLFPRLDIDYSHLQAVRHALDASAQRELCRSRQRTQGSQKRQNKLFHGVLIVKTVPNSMFIEHHVPSGRTCTCWSCCHSDVPLPPVR